MMLPKIAGRCSFFIATNKMSITLDVITWVKIIFVTFILLSPFLPYASLLPLNHLLFKMVMLLAILGVCFYDFQLAIILTIAFMILVLNLNQQHIRQSKNEHFVARQAFLERVDTSAIPVYQDEVPNETYTVTCPPPQEPTVDQDLFDHFIDEKIKPYEVFIRMMTHPSALSDAQGL